MNLDWPGDQYWLDRKKKEDPFPQLVNKKLFDKIFHLILLEMYPETLWKTAEIPTDKRFSTARGQRNPRTSSYRCAWGDGDV